ncbi:hypothetical protein EDB89DRAFT_465416 [Lactarius sanguifluus]|nr:hypothetical protein EDB89DRAFT_465416 [Lactarius sanguifluus]
MWIVTCVDSFPIDIDIDSAFIYIAVKSTTNILPSRIPSTSFKPSISHQSHRIFFIVPGIGEQFELHDPSDVARLLMTAVFSYLLHARSAGLVLLYVVLVLYRFASSFLIVSWSAYASFPDGYSRGMSFKVSTSGFFTSPEGEDVLTDSFFRQNRPCSGILL